MIFERGGSPPFCFRRCVFLSSRPQHREQSRAEQRDPSLKTCQAFSNRSSSAILAIIRSQARRTKMPIYEYICDDCSSQFEKIVINRQQEISCPRCSSKKATIQLSVFSSAVAGGSSKSSSGGSSSGGACCGGGCGCH